MSSTPASSSPASAQRSASAGASKSSGAAKAGARRPAQSRSGQARPGGTAKRPAGKRPVNAKRPTGSRRQLVRPAPRSKIRRARLVVQKVDTWSVAKLIFLYCPGYRDRRGFGDSLAVPAGFWRVYRCEPAD